MVKNGEDEISYANLTGDNGGLDQYIFRGGNRLSHYDGNRFRYATNWSFTQPGFWSLDTLSAQFETTSTNRSYDSGTDFGRARPSSSINAQGLQTFMTYDAADNVTGTSYPDGSTAINRYNGTLRVDRIGRATEWTYDAQGNELSRTTGLLWNAQTQTTQVTAATATWTKTYYPAGHANQFLLASSTDANGNTTDYVYDAATNYLLQVIEPADGLDCTTRHDSTPTMQPVA